MMDHPFIINPVQPPKDMIVRFYHEYEENGGFSNWYPASFEYAGQHYNAGNRSAHIILSCELNA